MTVAAFGTLLGLAGGLFAAWAVGVMANGAMERYSLALRWGTLLLVCPVSLAIGAAARHRLGPPGGLPEPAGSRRGGVTHGLQPAAPLRGLAADLADERW
ncbi:hypothetical protein [Microtetraspora fusca]|uniref:hypothetical protein n=1 Tax=Microtetraspora fusca TaxID=1997 RepID=UPI0008357A43|nr:hypothetical protein [Microtetraspora fusca]